MSHLSARAPAAVGGAPTRSTTRRRRLATLAALVVFAAGASTTAGIVGGVGRAERERDLERFDAAAEDTAASLVGHLHDYEQRLFTVRGLYASSEHVTRAEYATFVNAT